MLVLEVEENLRALLRDVVCGFLEPDLKGAADDILLQSGEHIEIQARDLRRTVAARVETPDSPGPTEAVLAQAAVQQRHAHPPPPPPPPPPDESLRLELRHADLREQEYRDAPWELDVQESGVTPSTDWDLDDDASSFAGPV